jgi:hypothetical protein
MMSEAMSGRAVVHGDVGPMVHARVDVFVVGLVVFALDGVGTHAVFLDECGGDVVLRAERVGGTKHDVGAAGLERAHEIGRLAGDVQTRADAHTLERLLFGEALADGGQHGHLHVGPLDAQRSLRSETLVFDVVGRCAHGDPSFVQAPAACIMPQAATGRP